MSALTVAERQQYDLAFEECFVEAQAEIDTSRTEVVESLPPDTRELLDAAASGLDPAFIEIEQQWVRCMAEAGHNCGGSAETFAFLNEELSRVSATAGSADDEALQSLERGLALADYDCAAAVEDALHACCRLATPSRE